VSVDWNIVSNDYEKLSRKKEGSRFFLNTVVSESQCGLLGARFANPLVDVTELSELAKDGFALSQERGKLVWMGDSPSDSHNTVRPAAPKATHTKSTYFHDAHPWRVGALLPPARLVYLTQRNFGMKRGSVKRESKKSVFTTQKARTAVKAAKKKYASKPVRSAKSWKKGGREWSRVLGHFGVAD